jgi:hypothetical protein
MSMPIVCDLKFAATELLNPLHKILLNSMFSYSLNNEIVLEFINNPILVPSSL